MGGPGSRAAGRGTAGWAGSLGHLDDDVHRAVHFQGATLSVALASAARYLRQVEGGGAGPKVLCMREEMFQTEDTGERAWRVTVFLGGMAGRAY